MNFLYKILLSPFAIIYGAIIWLRNWLYKTQFIGSTDFEVPVISIGNLSVGGTGKTPFVELLIEMLYEKYSVAILSRGYKRKTNGYLEVDRQHTSLDVGDEPLMLKLKYPHVSVCVGEQRVMAIPQLLSKHPETQVILLDDAFQHQSVRPDINILLTTYDNPFYDDLILPLGTLREFVSGKERANIIVITKCPEELGTEEQTQIINKIKPNKNQKVFFSTIVYGIAYNLLNPSDKLYLDINENYILLTGIANTKILKEYLANQSNEIIHFEFGDHHFFELQELERIKKNYPKCMQWICTEKDGVRLAVYKDWFIKNNIALYCLPIKTKIISNNAAEFYENIVGFLDFFYLKEETAPEQIE